MTIKPHQVLFYSSRTRSSIKSREKRASVFCSKNCFELMWGKNSYSDWNVPLNRTIYSSSESSEQNDTLLTCISRFQSYLVLLTYIVSVKIPIGKNNWDVETYRKKWESEKKRANCITLLVYDRQEVVFKAIVLLWPILIVRQTSPWWLLTPFSEKQSMVPLGL